jgi:hypothetical protein
MGDRAESLIGDRANTWGDARRLHGGYALRALVANIVDIAGHGLSFEETFVNGC